MVLSPLVISISWEDFHNTHWQVKWKLQKSLYLYFPSHDMIVFKCWLASMGNLSLQRSVFLAVYPPCLPFQWNGSYIHSAQHTILSLSPIGRTDTSHKDGPPKKPWVHVHKVLLLIQLCKNLALLTPLSKIEKILPWKFRDLIIYIWQCYVFFLGGYPVDVVGWWCHPNRLVQLSLN
jgi:hypothetical protein